MIKNLCRALSPLDEFIIVVTGAFGVFIYASIASVLSQAPAQPISAADLIRVIVFELIVSAPLLSFLHLRGWTIESIGLKPSLRETLAGIGLAIIIQLLTMPISLLFAASSEVDIDVRSAITNSPTDLSAIVAASVINPIFEEVFVCGYILTALNERKNLALFTSLSIRILYHVYQGFLGVLLILPFALVLTLWFGKTRQLWPLIVAHVVFDFIPLSYLVVR